MPIGRADRADRAQKPGPGVGPASAWLRAFRFRGFGSVHASDWIALEQDDGADTLAVPAPLFCASLVALARAAARRRRP